MSDPTSVIKVRSRLERLGEDTGIEASLPTGTKREEGAPDAFLILRDGRAWLVGFWTGRTVQPCLLPAEKEKVTLEERARGLAAWRRRNGRPGQPSPGLMLLAPALEDKELPDGVASVDGETVAVVSRRECERSASLARAIFDWTGPVLTADEVTRWRAAVVPEVRIQSPYRRQRVVRMPVALAAPLVLDYKQERCVRLDLDLDLEVEPSLEPVARDVRLRLVTGVAGCGKTLVLLHRAVLLVSRFPRAKILVVSFNRPLVQDLKRRLRTNPAAGRVECLTFYQWLRRVAPMPGTMVGPRDMERWIELERRSLKALDRHSAEWLAGELHWMLDHGLVDGAYLTAVRRGRGTRLSRNQRRELLELLGRYRVHLRATGKADWSEWPLAIRENLPEAGFVGRYDHLLIDEAQFFAPVWLDLLRGALKPSGHLFLCADPTQGFLRRRESWSTLGLDVRNRSVRLEKPYRSTRAILEFAKRFYERRLPAEDESLNLPSAVLLETLEAGARPVLRPGGPGQDQLSRIGQELRQLRAAGIPPDHVLVLVAGRTFSVEQVVRHLNTRLGPRSAVPVTDAGNGTDSTGVAHLMAATGLERPIVFLLGLDDLAAEEANPTLSEDERGEKWHDHTRQIYVGLTRAMERLVIYSSDPRLGNAFGAGAADEAGATG